MKKIFFIVLTVLICAGGVASTYFLLDHDDPKIEVSGTPVLACNVDLDDLMSFAKAQDDKGLKSFFIEEKDLNTIADNGYLTYVAIDQSNNVTKEKVSVNVANEVKTYHFELLQPLLFQVNVTPVVEDYVALKNNCGWNVKGRIEMDGINYQKIGTYEVEISSKKHSELAPLVQEAIVDDLRIPKIILNESYVEGYASRYYDDDYFLAFVDSLSDDKEDETTLYERLVCDWKMVLEASESGYVRSSGNYTITYTVSDTEGFTGMAQLNIRLIAPRVAETSEEEGE